MMGSRFSCGRGGTGRRAGFRFQWGNSWRFESSRPHHCSHCAGRHRHDAYRKEPPCSPPLSSASKATTSSSPSPFPPRRSTRHRRGLQGARQEVPLPGLPPGQGASPDSRQQLGREYVLAEATEDVVNESYPQGARRRGAAPDRVAGDRGARRSSSPARTSPTRPRSRCAPSSTLTDYDGFEVAVPPAEATAGRDRRAARGRPRAFRHARAGRGPRRRARRLRADLLRRHVDGEAYEGNDVDKYLYEMGRGLMPAEFDDGHRRREARRRAPRRVRDSGDLVQPGVRRQDGRVRRHRPRDQGQGAARGRRRVRRERRRLRLGRGDDRRPQEPHRPAEGQRSRPAREQRAREIARRAARGRDARGR